MSTWRAQGECCPIEPVPVHMDICQPCPYFRGASSRTGQKGWNIACNWPRNGSDLALRESLDDLPAKHIELLVNR
jgi:hypothetical protein